MINKRKLKKNRMNPEKVVEGLERLDIDPLLGANTVFLAPLLLPYDSCT